MTFGFLSASKNFWKLLSVSWEVFVLHGYDWIHWVAKSCTTTAYRWLFRDSQLSLRTLWSTDIKSPKFLHDVRLWYVICTVPCNLVLWQISQFRFFLVKWVYTLCFTLALKQMSQFRSSGEWVLPLLPDVPNLMIPENCVLVQAVLWPDFLWTPSTTQEDLPAGRLHYSSCHPSFYAGFGFLGIPAPVTWWLVPSLRCNTGLEDEHEAALFSEACSASLLNESCGVDVED